MDTVLILLASYNGQKYIGEMIDSIISQDYTDWKLILSDDGSSDGTADILEDYANKMPEKIVHYKSGKRFGNAQNHFLHLLEAFNDAPYIMFCDQDDVWHKDKISKTLSKMKETEKDAAMPTLVHTDLNVVDKDLCLLDTSFLHFSKLDGNRLDINHLLIQNVVTGCTVMMNNTLAKAAVKRLPAKEILMHDWWLALIASACGQIGFLPTSTIDYRQHGNNTVGANNVRSAEFMVDRLKSGKMKKSIQGCILQAKAFLSCYEDMLPKDILEIIKAFAALENKNFIARDVVYFKYKIHKYGFARIAAQYLGL